MDFVEDLNYKNEENKSSYFWKKKPYVTIRVINNLSHSHTKNSEITYQ